MSLNYYLCGGGGINIGAALKNSEMSIYNQRAKFVGLDTSDANVFPDLFDVVKMPDDPDGQTKGSGKVQSRHYHKSEPFIKQVLSEHKPASFNIVVFSDSGGTGSMLGIMLIRELITRGDEVVAVIASDHSSYQEMKNSLRTLDNLVTQTQEEYLDKPIAFMHIINEPTLTRGQINEKAVNRLNILSMFLNEENEEADFEDISSFLNYSEVLDVPAALSEIRFYDKKGAEEYTGVPPIAVISLFSHRDNVVSRFPGHKYRSTGVLKDNTHVKDSFEEIHMTLDHGSAIQELIEKVKILEKQEADKELTYHKSKSVMKGSKDGKGLNF